MMMTISTVSRIHGSLTSRKRRSGPAPSTRAARSQLLGHRLQRAEEQQRRERHQAPDEPMAMMSSTRLAAREPGDVAVDEPEVERAGR